MGQEPFELSLEGSALPFESQGAGGGAFQADGTARAKTLRQKGWLYFSFVFCKVGMMVTCCLRGLLAVGLKVRRRSTQDLVSAQAWAPGGQVTWDPTQACLWLCDPGQALLPSVSLCMP